jgi:hypothetical protein
MKISGSTMVLETGGTQWTEAQTVPEINQIFVQRQQAQQKLASAYKIQAKVQVKDYGQKKLAYITLDIVAPGGNRTNDPTKFKLPRTEYRFTVRDRGGSVVLDSAKFQYG